MFVIFDDTNNGVYNPCESLKFLFMSYQKPYNWHALNKTFESFIILECCHKPHITAK